MEPFTLTGKPAGKIKTEPTVTENGALYFSQHRVVNRRGGFFGPWRTRGGKLGRIGAHPKAKTSKLSARAYVAFRKA